MRKTLLLNVFIKIKSCKWKRIFRKFKRTNFMKNYKIYFLLIIEIFIYQVQTITPD